MDGDRKKKPKRQEQDEHTGRWQAERLSVKDDNIPIEIGDQQSSEKYEQIGIDSPVQSEDYLQQLKQVRFAGQEPNLLDFDPVAATSLPFRASQAEYLLDRVVDIEGPLLVQEGLINSYKLYKIKTKKADATSFDTSVSRRFSDFEYLHHSLLEDYGGCVIPKLPKKSVLAKFNLESNDFREDRVRHLRKYLTELLKHVRIRCCRQLRLFLFGQGDLFQLDKGEYFEKMGAIQVVKDITSNVLDYGYKLIHKGQGDIQTTVRESQEDLTIAVYERQVNQLLRISDEVRSVVVDSLQQLQLLQEILDWWSGRDSDNFGSKLLQQFKDFLEEYDDLRNFIDSCSEAIKRRTQLRLQIDAMKQQEKQIMSKSRQNPRNSELDIVKSKLGRTTAKCERWTASLLEELKQHTNEGRSMVETYIKKFTKLKAALYAQAV